MKKITLTNKEVIGYFAKRLIELCYVDVFTVQGQSNRNVFMWIRQELFKLTINEWRFNLLWISS